MRTAEEWWTLHIDNEEPDGIALVRRIQAEAIEEAVRVLDARRTVLREQYQALPCAESASNVLEDMARDIRSLSPVIPDPEEPRHD